jgi:putative membrane protein
MLTEADHKRITAAVAAAEDRTSGEIFCVLAHEVSRYREVPLVWAILAALVASPFLSVAWLHSVAQDEIFAGWTDPASQSAEGMIRSSIVSYTVFQALIFLAVALIVSIPAVRRAMTPRFLKRHRVRQVARHHFTASGARVSDAEPHILIFASLYDRQVELVAHEAIHQAVGDGPWNAAVAAVIQGMQAGRPADGFVGAIEICGAALAQHFPSDGPARNVLSNDIVEM